MTEKYYRELARVLKGHNIETDKFKYDFKLLSDFCGTILAGKETEIGGYQFATWEKDGSGNGYNYSHYFDSDYTAAKEDFALRQNLAVPKLNWHSCLTC